MSARSIRRSHERAEAQERRRRGRRGKRAGVATAAAIGASVVLTSPALAANFEVDTLDDTAPDDCATGDCTLREAVGDADANAGADSITFADSLGGTITLTLGELVVDDPAGLTITDAGVNEVTISGNDASRIFNVAEYANLNLSGLELTGGYGEGGIASYGGFPVKYGGGGAIYAGYEATVNVSDSLLVDNVGEYQGGAIASVGAGVTITGSTVADNQVVSGGSGFFVGLGGGIASTGARYGSPTTRANADRGPGEAALTITGSTISGNGAGAGGGVFSSGDKYSVGPTTRGVDASDLDPSLVTFDVTDSEISGNQAFLGGGSFSFYSDATFTGGEIVENYAFGQGGVGVLAARLDMTGTTVGGNYAQEFAGGIGAKYGSARIVDALITENYGGDVGGVALAGREGPDAVQGDSEIRRTTVTGNVADRDAGGVAIEGVAPGTSTAVVDSTISDNTAGGLGGGIFAAQGVGGALRVTNSTVSGNSADSGAGVSIDYGEVYQPPARESSGDEVYGDGSIALGNSTIASNTAETNGGGVYLGGYYDSSEQGDRRSTIDLSSTIVGDNTAAGSANDLDQIDEATGGGFRLDRSLIEIPGDATITQSPAGASIIGSDPALGGLAANGGPTETHLPAESSPAIDVGVANGLATDQRGEGRTVDRTPANGDGDGTDMGSVELPSNVVVNTRALLRSEVPAGCGVPFDEAALKLAGDGSSQTLQGGGGDDLLRGFGGDDSVLGAGGDDCLTGDDGTDVVTGDDGSDYADGGNGTDRVTGDEGDDEVRGAGGDDLVKGQDGDDQTVGGGGEDKVVGGAGDDNVRGRFGDDRVKGGAGDDAVRGGGGDDRVNGGAGDDSMRGGGGDDLMILGKGANDVNCGKGDDTVRGATPDDEVPKNCETVS